MSRNARITYRNRMDTSALNNLELDKKLLVQTLQSWNVIPQDGKYICNRCGGVMKLRRNNKYAEGYNWVCNNRVFICGRKAKVCEKSVSLRTGTIFENSKLTIIQILKFVMVWMFNFPVDIIMDYLKFSAGTASSWWSFCTEVLECAFQSHRQRLGGIGKVVELNQSVSVIRKFNVGKVVELRFTFGAYERGTGNVLFKTVTCRDTRTLVPILRKWIRPGTMIITDGWKLYNKLPRLGYAHVKVNHRKKFSCPSTCGHTNLAKCILLKKCRLANIDPFLGFLKMAGELYNPMSKSRGIPVHAEEAFERYEGTFFRAVKSFPFYTL